MEKKKKPIILIVIAICILSYVYNNFFTKSMLLGRYVNTNYEYGPFLADVPYNEDNLMLYADNHFTSNFYGSGTYKLAYSIRGTEIILIYHAGSASYRLPIHRNYFYKIKLVIHSDMNHYYGKL